MATPRPFYRPRRPLVAQRVTHAELAFDPQVTERSASRHELRDALDVSCSTNLRVTLFVTGDKILRTEAQARLGAVYGLLWILDQMEASEKVPATLLLDGLTRISNHPRCRLPQAEVRARLARWSGA